ncbi:MAG: hemin receptor [Rhodocyclaceae bacterium]|nr:Hemin receptor [Bacteroidia bacterium]MCQ3924543.1 hemin receptor [Rhodocyclaceae bacterium]
MKYPPSPALLPAAIAAAFLPTALHAQAAETTLTPVSVTAKGYAAEDLDTPVSSTTLDRDEILRRNAQNPGEALRGEPGLAVASDGAQGQNPVIRGLKKESVVLLVDGMRLNSAQPAGAVASFMSLGLADRIEVVKGPASVLYGTGALGGAINVLLPQARFEPGAKFSAAASYDSASRGVRGTGVLNASGGDHALMLGASLARINDYKAPDGRVDRTGYDSDSFIGQYRFRIDNAQQLRFSLQRHEDEDVWYPGSAKAHPSALVRSTIVRSPEQARMLAEVGYSRKGAGESPLNFDVRAYRQEMERRIYAWSDTRRLDISRTHVFFTTDGVDAKADWLVHPQHLLSFGANYWKMGASPERFLANPPTFATVRRDPFDDGRLSVFGVYVQDDMRFGKLNVLAALRHDTVKGEAAAMANPANPALKITNNLDRRDSAFSGSLGAIYEADPLLRPYANLSRAFRAGEMRERYESSPRGDGYYYAGNPQIKPEISTQFEIGLKGQSERAGYQVALWRNRIADYMSGLDISGTARAVTVCGAANAAACKETVNISQVTLHGFEAQGKWQFSRGHWLKAGFSLVRGTNDALDEPLFQMPADELSLGWEGGVAANWTMDVTGRFVRRQNRVATVFSRGSENKTGGFATADVGATWRYAKSQSLRFGVKNLFDREYHEHLTEGVSGQEIHMPGRSLVLTWKGDF